MQAKKLNSQVSLYSNSSEIFNVDINTAIPQLNFKNSNGSLFLGDCILWLKTLESNSVDLCFADPPYNIKKEVWDNFDSMEKYISWSLDWIKEVSRVLKPNGTLYVCGFSEILADLKHPSMKYFKGCRWIVWHYKNKANLGKDWGRSHESILHFRKGKSFTLNIDDIRIPYGEHTLKYPGHPQAETSNFGKGNNKKRDDWYPHPNGAKPKDVIELPTTCNGSNESTAHPTQKPEGLLRKLVLASSNENDLVIDPFSGSGTTAVVSEQLNRKWLACDNNEVYNSMAIKRLQNVVIKSKDEWIKYDKENAKRRESNR
ncbi:MAG: site-specific DNA-methyltransferase [Bacteroidetes bacterium]|nr:site-specific DNA-methyltransferase [Bacteroidota bacterium]